MHWCKTFISHSEGSEEKIAALQLNRKHFFGIWYLYGLHFPLAFFIS